MTAPTGGRAPRAVEPPDVCHVYCCDVERTFCDGPPACGEECDGSCGLRECEECVRLVDAGAKCPAGNPGCEFA